MAGRKKSIAEIRAEVEAKKKGAVSTSSTGDPALERRLAAAREKNKKIIPMESGAWDTADPAEDPVRGLGAQPSRVQNVKSRQKHRKRLVLRERDFQIVTLLIRYRYASRAQLERHFGVVDLSRRLTQLKNAGFIHNELVTRTQGLWTATTAGMDLVDLDFPNLVYGVNPSGIAHTLGLVNIGSDLETGKLDSTLLSDDLAQNPNGEIIITEREMTQSFNINKEILGPVQMREEYLDLWGSEPWTYLMHDTDQTSSRFGRTHRPDMIIDRGGKGEDIAIELELSNKRKSDWRGILKMFAASPYKKVIYYTHRRSIATSLANIDSTDVGLGDRLDIRVYRPLHSNIPFWG